MLGGETCVVLLFMDDEPELATPSDCVGGFGVPALGAPAALSLKTAAPCPAADKLEPIPAPLAGPPVAAAACPTAIAPLPAAPPAASNELPPVNAAAPSA